VSKHADVHAAGGSSSRKPALFDATSLLAKMFWTVPETAFMCRLSTRTVWRLMADPRSGFPEPRRVRGRTLLAAEAVLEFMEASA
jgi:hypothetical protein